MEKKTAEEFLKAKGIKDTLYNLESNINGTEVIGELKWIKGGLSALLDEYATQSRPEPSVGRYSEEDIKVAIHKAYSYGVDRSHYGQAMERDIIATLTKQGSEEEGRGV